MVVEFICFYFILAHEDVKNMCEGIKGEFVESIKVRTEVALSF